MALRPPLGAQRIQSYRPGGGPGRGVAYSRPSGPSAGPVVTVVGGWPGACSARRSRGHAHPCAAGTIRPDGHSFRLGTLSAPPACTWACIGPATWRQDGCSRWAGSPSPKRPTARSHAGRIVGLDFGETIDAVRMIKTEQAAWRLRLVRQQRRRAMFGPPANPATTTANERDRTGLCSPQYTVDRIPHPTAQPT
jgi:hypothetical protein